jgi:hypothetical protein
MIDRGPCVNYPGTSGCQYPIAVTYQGVGFCCYQCLYCAFTPPEGQHYIYEEQPAPAAVAVLEPVGDPIHTIRRAASGFGHYIKLDQATRRECWMCIDGYGPMSDLGDRLRREDEVQDCPVVYTPAPDEEWGHECNS